MDPAIPSSMGMHITLAESVDRAHELIHESSPPDLVISDFRLSEQTHGVELIHNLR